MFNSTSLIVALIEHTIYDIRVFVFVFFMVMIYFGAAFNMLMLNSAIDHEFDVVPDALGNVLANNFMNQYLLSLGQFQLEAFDEHTNAILCYLFFFIATFLI